MPARRGVGQRQRNVAQRSDAARLAVYLERDFVSAKIEDRAIGADGEEVERDRFGAGSLRVGTLFGERRGTGCGEK